METNCAPIRPGQEPLRRLDITFTDSGLSVVRVYREKLAAETGQRVTLARALDNLLKTHPFATGGSRNGGAR